jgi:type I restriction enzyme M protein
VAKRHHFIDGDWKSIFGRLEELILARSGEDPFGEILKLVVAVLDPENTSCGTVEELRQTLEIVNRKWPELFSGRTHRLLLSDDLAAQCLEILKSMETRDSSFEALDAAFETLHSRVSKGTKGQFFTPRHVIEACVQVLNPRAGELVADTACGSGGFLVHALQHMTKENDSRARAEIAENDIWGFDFDQRAIDVARALMILASGTTASMIRSDSLLRPSSGQHLFQSDDEVALPTVDAVMQTRFKKYSGFDVILTNPPFAGDMRDASLLNDYEVSRGKSRIERDILFVERNVELLRPGGRIAIVLPHNKVAGRATTDLRTWLLRNLQVVSVLGLARESFMPHTSQKAVIVFGVRRERPLKSLPDEEILFVVSEKSGKTSKGEWVFHPEAQPNQHPWVRVDHDLREVVHEIRAHATKLELSW